MGWGPGKAPNGLCLSPSPVARIGRPGEAGVRALRWCCVGMARVSGGTRHCGGLVPEASGRCLAAGWPLARQAPCLCCAGSRRAAEVFASVRTVQYLGVTGEADPHRAPTGPFHTAALRGGRPCGKCEVDQSEGHGKCGTVGIASSCPFSSACLDSRTRRLEVRGSNRSACTHFFLNRPVRPAPG